MELDLSGPRIAALKAHARELRQERVWSGKPTTHAEALELMAGRHGARDWNTLHARLKRPVRLSLGSRVSGQYLSQPFEGYVHGLNLLDQGRRMRVVLHLDQPIDVVKFDSFSSMLQRVRAVIGADGRSMTTTSDGVPHLILETVEG